jgi:histidinol-phosphatase
VLDEEIALAREMADRAAEIALSHAPGLADVLHKADGTPVTESDLLIEELVRVAVRRRFPEDAVLGEEGGLQGSGDRVWVVDPIDGTRNFVAGVQIWATLIALHVGGEPVLGVAGAPELGERYEAVRGCGASLNGRPIHVSSTAKLSEAFVTLSGLQHWEESEHRHAFHQLVRSASYIREFGDFWGHMLVARGSSDAMVEPSLRVWDTSALRVIVQEAGGTVTGLDGGPLIEGGPVLTTNGHILQELVTLFSRPALR